MSRLILALILALMLVCATVRGAELNLAWDASASSGCEYRLYAQSNTNIVRVECGTNLTARLEDIAPGFYSFWATATKDGVESDPSNVLAVEVPQPPQGIRTLVVDHATAITNWTEFFRVRFQ